MIFSSVDSYANLSIAGLHYHIGETPIFTWHNRVAKIIEIIDTYFADGIDYIDLGSGMHRRLHYDKSIPKISDIRSIENYAIAALKPFYDYYISCDNSKKPIIFTEPGTILVRNCLDLVTKVKAIKTINNQTFIIVDSSRHNIGNESYLDYRPIRVIRMKKSEEQVCQNALITGYTCIEEDVLFSGFSDNLAVGDYIVFGDVGAYSIVEKPPFIYPNGSVLSIDPKGNVHPIKRSETFEYLMDTYVF